MCEFGLICGFYLYVGRKKTNRSKSNRFEHEFGRFADLRTKIKDLSLNVAENCSANSARCACSHTGKKSEIANAKKLIGRVAPEERGAFGQFVQRVEKEIVGAIEEAETNLKDYISRRENRARSD